MTDFSSLEPCNSDLIPYRLLQPNNNEIRLLEEELTDFYEDTLPSEYK
jgi:hypothetical protein